MTPWLNRCLHSLRCILSRSMHQINSPWWTCQTFSLTAVTIITILLPYWQSAISSVTIYIWLPHAFWELSSWVCVTKKKKINKRKEKLHHQYIDDTSCALYKSWELIWSAACCIWEWEEHLSSCVFVGLRTVYNQNHFKNLKLAYVV